MTNPPQFFNQEKSVSVTPWPEAAIYEVSGVDGQPTKIAVQTLAGTGNIPRNASWASDLASFKGVLHVENEMAAVAAMAQKVVEALKNVKPDELAVEFGIALGGKLGIPLVTEGEAKANFKVTVKWASKKSVQEPTSK